MKLDSDSLLNSSLLLYAVNRREAGWGGETLYSQVEKALKGGATNDSVEKRICRKRHFWMKPGPSRSCVRALQGAVLINDSGRDRGSRGCGWRPCRAE